MPTRAGPRYTGRMSKPDERPPYRYRLSWTLEPHPDGITKAELLAAKRSGCDAVILCSMIYPEDGSFSLALFSADGRTGGEVSDDEKFKVWTMMAQQLAESPELGPGKRAFAAGVFESFRQILLAAREAPKEDLPS